MADQKPWEQYASSGQGGGSAKPWEEFGKPAAPSLSGASGDTSIGTRLRDWGVAGGGGVVQGTKMLTDAAGGAGNRLSQRIGRLADKVEGLGSPQRQARLANRAQTIRDAEKSGSTWEEVKASVGAFTEAPVETTLSALGTSIPTIAAAALTRGRAAPAVVGGAQGAGAVKGSIYEAVEQAHTEAGATPAEAAEQAREAQSYTGQNATQIGIGTGLGVLAATTGVEGVVGRMVGRRAGREVAEAAAPGVLQSAGLGIARETPMEMLQGGQERLASNVALQGEGFDTPTMEGVVGQAALEGLASAPMGAGFGAVEGLQNQRLARQRAAEEEASGLGAGAAPIAGTDIVDPVAARVQEHVEAAAGADSAAGPLSRAVNLGAATGAVAEAATAQALEEIAAQPVDTAGAGAGAGAGAPAGPGGITPEAQELLASVDSGGVPAMFTSQLRRIAAENGLTIAPTDTPANVIAALLARAQATPADAAPPAPPAPPAGKASQPVDATTTSAGRVEAPAENRQEPAGNQMPVKDAGRASAGAATSAALADPIPPSGRAQPKRPASRPRPPAETAKPSITDEELAERLRAQLKIGNRITSPEFARAMGVPVERVARIRSGLIGEIQQQNHEALLATEYRSAPAANRARRQLPTADRYEVEKRGKNQFVLRPKAQPALDLAATPVVAPQPAPAARPASAGAAEAVADGAPVPTAAPAADVEPVQQPAARSVPAPVDEPPPATDGSAAPADIDAAAHEAATSPRNDRPEPTEAQKEAGNYKVGRVSVHGLNLSIENPKGSVRSGTSPDGTEWQNTMGAHYGYIRGHGEGADGDHVDVFLGDRPDSQRVWVIDQVNADGSFDEHKVLLGFPSHAKAIQAYKASYSKGWKVGPVTRMTVDEFKEWLQGDTTKPLAALPAAAETEGRSDEEAVEQRDTSVEAVRARRRKDKAFKEAFAHVGEPHVESGPAAQFLRGWLDAEAGRPMDEMQVTRPTPDMRPRGFNPVDHYRSGFQSKQGGAPVLVRVLEIEPAGGNGVAEEPALYSGYERGSSSLQVEQRAARSAPDAQLDLFAPAAVPAGIAAEQSRDNFRLQYRQAAVGTIKSGIDTVTGPSEAAHVFASFRKHAQETMLALVTDENGKILNLIRHTKGLKASSPVSTAELVGAIVATDGGAQVWLGHNHPSGNPAPSPADYKVTDAVNRVLDGAGVTLRGHVVVGEGLASRFFGAGETIADAVRVMPAIRNRTIDITERVLRRRPAATLPVIDGPDGARMAVADIQADNAVMLLSTDHRVVGELIMSPAEMATLRQGGRVQRLLRALDTTNASRVILKATDPEAAANVARFFNNISEMRVLDAFIRQPDGIYQSEAARGLGAVTEATGPFYSRPSSRPGLDEVKAAWRKAGIDFSFVERGDVLTVSKVVVPEGARESGIGTRAMDQLVAWADASGKHLALTPSADFGGSKARLTAFYKRFGFKENKGGSRVFSVTESMIRENPNANPLYRRTDFRPGQPVRGVQTEQVRRALATMTQGWANAPTVEVVQSIRDLPTWLRRRLERDGATDAEGMFVDGRVYLVADNLDSIRHGAFVLAHEVLGHAGLQGAFGKRLNAKLNEIYRDDAAIRQAADWLMERFGYSKQVAVEEVLADMAADGRAERQTWWPRLVAAVRNALRAIGLRMQWTDADVRGLLANARRHIEGGRRGAGGDLRLSRGGSMSTAGTEPIGRYAELGQGRVSLAQTVKDASAIVGFEVPFEVRVTQGLDPMVPARFNLDARTIEINELFDYPRERAAAMLVEEVLHGIDVVGGQRTISASSKLFDLDTGAIAREAVDHYIAGGSLAGFLEYPLGQAYASYSADRIKAELFARLGTMYLGDPQLLRETLPNAYRAYDEIFGLARENPIGEGAWVFRRVWGARPAGAGESLQSVRDGAGVGGNAAGANRQRGAGEGLADLRRAVAGAIEASPLGRKTNLRDLNTQDPDARYRPGGVAFAAADAAVNSSPTTNPYRYLKRAAGDRTINWRPKWLKFLTRQQVVDIGKDILPQASEFERTARAMDADANNEAQKFQPIAERWSEWANSLNAPKRGAAARMAALMHDATVAGVDPDQPRPIVANGLRADEIDRKRVEAWDDLRKKFDALPEELQQLYRDVRDAYTQRRQDMFDALESRILKSEAASEHKRAMIDKLRREFESQTVQGPYFPLARFGDFFVVAEKDGQRHFAMFETVQERRAALPGLREDGWAIVSQGKNVKQLAADLGPSADFMADAMTMITESVDGAEADALKDGLWQMYLRSLPEASIRKQFIHRKNTQGFSRDALRAFASQMAHGSKQLARLRYGHQLANILRDMKRDAVTSDDPDKAADIIGALDSSYEWMMNPSGATWANRATSIGFLWYLGVSPAAAAVNLLQTPMVTLPVLGARYGFGKAAGALAKAGNDYLGYRLNKEKRAAVDAEFDGQMGVMLDELERSGAIDRTQTMSLMGMSEENSTVNLTAERWMKKIGYLFHQAERMNREATAMAAYRLAREAGAAHGPATQAAYDAIFESHFDYGSSNRAELMRGNMAKVLLLFKQYSQNMTYLLWRNAYQMFKGASPEVRKEAGKKLAGIMGMTFAFSGVMGLPLASSILWIVDAIAGAFGDDDEPWDAELAFRQFLGEMAGPTMGAIIARGAANDAGVDIASRVGLGELWVRSPQRDMEGKALALHYLEQAAGPVVGIGVTALQGLETMQRPGQFWRGAESLVPKFMRDMAKAARYTGEGVLNMRGDVVLSREELGVVPLLMQASGFSPSAVNERWDQNNQIKRIEQQILDRRKQLMNRWWAATQAGDGEAVDETLEMIQHFNEKNPELAITGKALRQSARSRLRYSGQAQEGIQVNPKLRERLDEMRYLGG